MNAKILITCEFKSQVQQDESISLPDYRIAHSCETWPFSGTVVQALASKSDFLLADRREVAELGEQLAVQAVGIFVGSPFPGSGGGCETDICINVGRNNFMLSELLNVFDSDGLDPTLVLTEGLNGLVSYVDGCSAGSVR